MSTKSFGKVTDPLGFVSVSPLPGEAELARFYADVYYQQQASTTYQAEYSADELAHRRLRAELAVHALVAARGDRPGGSLLDVGAGEGFVLAAAAAAGFDVAGIDFSSFAVAKFNPDFKDCVATGDAFELLERRITAGQRVDVCTLQNVVEHVREPLVLLERVRRVLLPGGLAMITVPNDYSRMQERAKELGLSDKDYWFAPPQHLHYFNVDSIGPVAAKAGFSVVDAYADFPIELFLFHPKSNYVLAPEQGKAAHAARVTLDLLFAERGLAAYHRLCQAMTGCGIGRNVTVILRPGAGA